MSDRRRLVLHLALVSTLGSVLLLAAGAVSGLAADKTIEATGGVGTYNWTPETATIDANGTVEFKNGQATPHGVVFDSPPAAPSCPGVSTTGSGNWSGTCTFVQAGTYNFHCYVHPTEMTGTITVNSTGPSKPTVTAESATGVTDTGATLKGSVNPNGEATKYWFEYGTTTGYGTQTTTIENVTTSGSKSASVGGLTANTLYHFRMVAENGTGKTEGADRTFTTGGPPTATTESATGVKSIEATLKGTVNPHGLATTYFFNYGTTTAYGQKTTEKSAGSGTANVAKTEVVTGLAPNTEYHFQVVAKNAAGGGSEVKGSDLTFTTTAVTPPTATTGQATEVGETSAKLGGTVNPQGQLTKYFFNYGTTTGYGQKSAEISAGSGIGNVTASQQLSGLSPGTTYHFQLVAINSGGTTPGLDQTFTTASTPPPPPPPPPPLPAPAPIPPPPAAGPPDTTITGKPPAKTRDRTPTIKFKASVGGASYQCSVDSKPFKTCRSPFTAPALKPGRHRIRVKASAGGASDPTPASVSFKVIGGRK
jgi:plastocyanin